MPPIWRQRLAYALPLLLWAAGLVAGPWSAAGGGALQQPWHLVGLAAAGVLAALHRPLGEASLGLGTVV
ncbi:MAG: hypothetical protein D6696_02260, partial [Acidobacteria bacterium]